MRHAAEKSGEYPMEIATGSLFSVENHSLAARSPGLHTSWMVNKWPSAAKVEIDVEPPAGMVRIIPSDRLKEGLPKRLFSQRQDNPRDVAINTEHSRKHPYRTDASTRWLVLRSELGWRERTTCEGNARMLSTSQGNRRCP